MNKRIDWPDFCKFVAMFLVTFDHASQVVSNQIFNNLLGGVVLLQYTCLYFL